MAGLGTSFLDTLVGSAVTGVEDATTTWLVQQYATLRAMPNRLQALRRAQQAVLVKIPSDSPDGSEDLARTIDAGTALQELFSEYPAMMQGVDRAYQTIQRDLASANPTNALLQDAAAIAGAAYDSQRFLSGVSAVDTELKSVIDHLLSTGAATPSEATAIYASAQSDTSGWGKWVMYGLLGLAALWILPRIVRIRR
jgi:glutamine synthetase adenylyltransferase